MSVHENSSTLSTTITRGEYSVKKSYLFRNQTLTVPITYRIYTITVVLIRDQTRSVAKQVSVAVGRVKIEISLMAQLKGLTAKFKLM